MRALLRFLRSQKTGVICSVLSALLLGAGSFVMDNFTSDYAGLHWDDLRFFISPIRAVHAWFYALAATIGVWVLSTLVCTWDSLRARLRNRVLRPSAYGAPLVHLCFALAVFAHLWGGLTGDYRQHVVRSSGTDIAGARYRAVGIEQEAYPNGMPKRVEATLERTDALGSQHIVIGYDVPWVEALGARALLYADSGTVVEATLRLGDTELRLQEGERGVLGGRPIVLNRLLAGRSLRVPVAQVVDSGTVRLLPLQPQAPPGEVAFVALKDAPAVLLTERINPSVPLIIGVAVILGIGVILVGFEHAYRRRRAEG